MPPLLTRPSALALCLAVCFPAILPGAADSPAPELIPIFNGRDLAGWESAKSSAFWRVENGVLVGENDPTLAGNLLWTERDYNDFVLEFDVRWHGEIDSGVEFRRPRNQLQLGISRSLKRDMSGSFYIGKEGYPDAGQSKDAGKFMKPEGEWNTFRLEARGSTFTVWINGTKTVTYTSDKFAGPSPLGLQVHPGLKMKVEYRNLRAAALP